MSLFLQFSQLNNIIRGRNAVTSSYANNDSRLALANGGLSGALAGDKALMGTNIQNGLEATASEYMADSAKRLVDKNIQDSFSTFA